MPHPEPIKPTAWSPMGQARLSVAVGTVTAKTLDPPVNPSTLSRWCMGRTLTPSGRVPELVRVLKQRGFPDLTASDLGRPDLNQTRKAKA
jgi:hypothetical protein